MDKKPATQPSINFAALSASVFSQGAEDGMLERIFQRLPPRRRFCVEFGAGDGLRNSNTARLVREEGWQGVMIEGSDRAHFTAAAIDRADVAPITVL